MKKFMMMALMAAAVTVASAQDAVKEAKKLLDKGEYAEALKTVEPALNAGTDADKAAAWNMVNEINYTKFSKIQVKKI
jgi:hypothetical protein